MAKAVQVFYKVHKTAEHNMFQVHKLSVDLEPLASYNTTSSNYGKPRCSCPSYKRPCKHVGIVNHFLREGCPEDKALNSLTDKFESII